MFKDLTNHIQQRWLQPVSDSEKISILINQTQM